jgi:DNA polymerase
MGAIDFGVKEEELQPLVNAWRDSNPNIVDFWWKVDKAIKKAVGENKTVKLGQLIFEYRSKMLFIHLPSGRKLSYVKPEIREGQITYYGIGDNKKYIRLESYGPKFVENIVQATARDLLVYAIKNLNLPIVMHIHDEVVVDAPKELDVESVVKTMTIVPKWGRGLILNADGYECDFYKKD